MTVEEKKERNRKYGAICARAKAMGIMKGDAIGAIIDIDSADQKFNLRLDEFLEADNFNFAHDFIGIQENIVRESFPATDFGYFVPRFAGRDLPKRLEGCVIDTTTKAPNVWMGSSNTARLSRSSSSSKRYKHDITSIDTDLNTDVLYNLPVRSYTYNDDYLSEDDRNYRKRMIGFIAEEVAEIYPKACQYDDQGRPEMWNVQIMVPALLDMIQKLHTEVTEIKGKLF